MAILKGVEHMAINRDELAAKIFIEFCRSGIEPSILRDKAYMLADGFLNQETDQKSEEVTHKFKVGDRFELDDDIWQIEAVSLPPTPHEYVIRNSDLSLRKWISGWKLEALKKVVENFQPQPEFKVGDRFGEDGNFVIEEIYENEYRVRSIASNQIRWLSADTLRDLGRVVGDRALVEIAKEYRQVQEALGWIDIGPTLNQVLESINNLQAKQQQGIDKNDKLNEIYADALGLSEDADLEECLEEIATLKASERAKEKLNLKLRQFVFERDEAIAKLKREGQSLRNTWQSTTSTNIDLKESLVYSQRQQACDLLGLKDDRISWTNIVEAIIRLQSQKNMIAEAYEGFHKIPTLLGLDKYSSVDQCVEEIAKLKRDLYHAVNPDNNSTPKIEDGFKYSVGDRVDVDHGKYEKDTLEIVGLTVSDDEPSYVCKFDSGTQATYSKAFLESFPLVNEDK